MLFTVGSRPIVEGWITNPHASPLPLEPEPSFLSMMQYSPTNRTAREVMSSSFSLQVALIEELVVGYETTLKNCRMFNENGETKRHRVNELEVFLYKEKNTRSLNLRT